MKSSMLSFPLLLPAIALSQTVNFAVTVNDSPAAISPCIYGTNQLMSGGENWGSIQMAGFVARDKNGVVDSSQTAPSSRWAYVKPAKSAPLSLTPDAGSDSVYMDEFVNFPGGYRGPRNNRLLSLD